MIILYIPFPANNSGDLTNNAELWKKNYAFHSSENIQIIHHQDSFDEDMITDKTTVFVLAHGADTNPDILANCTDPTKATIINPDELVSRFDHDMLIIAHHIGNIHLYCCGERGKNAIIAAEFQKNLLRPEYSAVKYYGGTIHVPTMSGSFFSSDKTGVSTPAVATTLSSCSISLDEENHRSNVKENSVLDNKEVRKASIARYLNHKSKYREERKEMLRGYSDPEPMVAENSSAPSAPIAAQSTVSPMLRQKTPEKPSFRARQRMTFISFARAVEYLDIERYDINPSLVLS
ncbi:hypothetical protein [Legionella cardiaca]|uniref:RNA binding protein (Contains ribosomal protein S1 domain) n=1 Tax=Legionella cardiaca TaxID=1071983 RepID=A0ABY8AQX4_9GAMM|nr:hypothetical protein [Legionella cardiaca]WED42839.1 hypothetical protein PXX05_13190 [Legionella cardiaca]